jgi:hypothetical protein
MIFCIIAVAIGFIYPDPFQKYFQDRQLKKKAYKKIQDDFQKQFDDEAYKQAEEQRQAYNKLATLSGTPRVEKEWKLWDDYSNKIIELDKQYSKKKYDTFPTRELKYHKESMRNHAFIVKKAAENEISKEYAVKKMLLLADHVIELTK